MRGIDNSISAITLNSVHLEGGPSTLSGTVVLAELNEVICSAEKIKIRLGNGYEHYEFIDTPVRFPSPARDAESGASDPLKLRWVGRTKIAE
ncbi:DUF5988 family protein [Streptomyces aureoverticillatus]|uniref:DUF5988 family protein n=1 Tax=Streptomyces aureoverticillatus TaxID=66871 RepID=UPI0013D9910C|nr:DUF5988 family protein [Streptomyces aureoverticillatus]QIB42313.1 hypothetical protein G3H79_03680 [Streptomyces aureoverticillatus]